MSWLIPGALDLMPWRRYELMHALAGLNATGVPLVGLSDGRPYAAGFSDDPGLFYFVPLLARATGLSLDAAVLLFVGGILALALVIGVGGWCVYARSTTMRIGGSVVMTLIAYWALRLGDVYAVATALPLAAVPPLLLVWRRGSPWRGWALALALTGLAAGCAGLVRSEALLAVPVFAAVLALANRREPWLRRAVLVALLVVAAAIPGAGMRIVEWNRDRYLAQAVPGYVAPPHAHSIWHSVYIGLGYLNNDYGLAYKDIVAYARVATVRPGTPIYSPQYAAVLRHEVLRLAWHDPAFVGRTFMAKAGAIAFYLLVFGNIGLVAAWRARKPRELELAFLAALGVAALPGLLVVPVTRYLEGFTALTVLYALVSLDWALARRRAGASRTAPEPRARAGAAGAQPAPALVP